MKTPRTTPRSAGGLVIRERDPLNLEMPFDTLDGFITPVDRFYVRSHFPVPDIDLKRWRLTITGECQQPLKVSLQELLSLEPITVPVTLECAGNGRAFLTPSVAGAQWELGAVGTAEWTGVRLADVLRMAGLKQTAREVICEGADTGRIKDPPGPAGRIHYARSMPVDKAMDDVILAFQMNGEALPSAHGGPVRLVVPGWYGMASVKWLTRVIASAVPYHGYYQTVDYSYWERGPSAPTLVPITAMQVKAQIARPGFAEKVRAGRMYRVAGAAWTADGDVTKVDISTDAGRTWHPTRLLGKPIRHAWRLWQYLWRVPNAPGKFTLLVRATDSSGRTQPTTRDADRGSYIINHSVGIEVDVAE